MGLLSKKPPTNNLKKRYILLFVELLNMKGGECNYE